MKVTILKRGEVPCEDARLALGVLETPPLTEACIAKDGPECRRLNRSPVLPGVLHH
jgi:hypothetical protein